MSEQVKSFEALVYYTFPVKVKVKAESMEEAERMIEQDCAFSQEIGFHTTRDDVVDYDYSPHASVEIAGIDEAKNASEPHMG